MNCELVQEKLDAYVDESLAPDDRNAVEEHVRGCAACAANILAKVQMKRATRLAAASFTQSSAFRMRPEFRQQLEKKILKGREPLGRKYRLTWLAAGALAMVLVLVAIVWSRQQARNADLAELLDVHIATLASANPVDVVSSDRHTVKPWFQGKLPFTFNLPELENSPYKLLGGKLIYFEQRPAAQLLFELHKHQVSVFIVQDDSMTRGSAIASKSERGFSTETWTQNGLRYVAISDTNPADVHALAELLRSAAK